MPFHFEFNKPHRVLRLVYDGEISDRDVRASIPAAIKAVAACDPASALIDLSGVTGGDVSTPAIRYVADHDPPFGDMPRCYVAPTDYLYGLTRMFQILADERRPNLHVLRSVREANRLLGIPDDLIYEAIPEK